MGKKVMEAKGVKDAEGNVWHKGEPPHVGWWNASRTRNSNGRYWRWWDGKDWSTPMSDIRCAEDAAEVAQSKAYLDEKHPIEWCDYYPKNARVPRVKP